MKVIGKIVNYFLVILFSLLGIYTFYLLNNFPDELLHDSKFNYAINWAYGFYFAGTIAVIYNFIYSHSSLSKELIYVDKISSNKINNKESNILSKDESDNDKLKKSLSDIQTIIETSENPNRKLDKILSSVCNSLGACQGIIYKNIIKNSSTVLIPFATYAFVSNENKTIEFQYGEGLVGMAAKEDRVLNINDVPEGYIKILSGLGNSSPHHIMIMPLKNDGEVTGIIELALFNSPDRSCNEFMQNVSTRIGKMI